MPRPETLRPFFSVGQPFHLEPVYSPAVSPLEGQRIHLCLVSSRQRALARVLQVPCAAVLPSYLVHDSENLIAAAYERDDAAVRHCECWNCEGKRHDQN